MAEQSTTFDEFVAHRGPALLRLAYLLTQDQGASERLVRDALVRARRRWRSLQGQDPEGHVRRVVVDDFLRRRPSLRGGRSELLDGSPQDEPDPVWAALGRLSKRERAVLVLRHHDGGQPDSSIAALLGCPESAVHGLADRALNAVGRPERMVGDVIRSHEFESPRGDGLLGEVRERGVHVRRRRLSVVAVATVAVAALVGSAVVGGSAPKNARKTADFSGVIDAPRPPGTQPVSYHGVEIFVPDTWRLDVDQCRTPQRNAVLIEDEDPVVSCQVPQPRGLTVVRLTLVSTQPGQQRAALATQPVVVNGVSARRGRGVPVGQPVAVSVLVLPQDNVVVSVESPDPAAVQQILDSTRSVPVDDFGCATGPSTHDTLAANAMTERSAKDALVDGSPSGAVICRYTDGWVSRATELSASDRAALVRDLRALPAGVSHPPAGYDESPMACAQDGRHSYRILFRYSGYGGDTVDVRISGCDGLSATNGLRTTKISPALVGLLVRAVGYDGAYPDPRTLR
jgi:DNA-directed RNA polymerase specialized sigma24 family protein